MTTWKKNEPTASLRRCVLQVSSLTDGSFAPAATDLTGLVKMRAGGSTLASAAGTFTNIGAIDGLWLYEATQGETNVSVNEVSVHIIDSTWYAQTIVAIDAGSSLADGSISLATFSADALLGAFGILASGTAQTGTATSITLATGSSSSNSAYVNARVLTVDGTGALQLTQATGYDGTTKVLTVADTWGVIPDATTQYVLLAGDSPQAHGYKLLEGINVEGSNKFADLLRGLVSLLMAGATGYDTDAPSWKSLDGTKTRWSGTVDDSGRPTITPGDLT